MSGIRSLLTLIVFAIAILGPNARAQNLSTSSLSVDTPSEEHPRKWSGEWALALGEEDFTQGKDEGVGASIFLKSKFEYRFAPWLTARVLPRIDSYSSRLQERFDNDDYKSKFRVSEFVVDIKPNDYVDIQTGAISEEYLNLPLLISRARAFPGLKEVFGGDLSRSGSNLKAWFMAQQTVPTSYSMDVEREDREFLPTFSTESFHLAGKNFDVLEWKAFAGHFNWSNLPDIVAFDSATLGNSVVGDVAPGARFVSGFDGYFAGGEVCVCDVQGRFGLVAEFQRLLNTRAEAGFGNAQMWGLGPHVVMGEQTLDLRYRRFFSEKDSTIAYYMSAFTGNTNRMGDDVEFKLDFRKYGFAIVGEWANAVTIRDNPLQQTLTSVYLGVETHYASF